MRFLVTGGSGFIGSHLVEHLVNSGDVRILDNLRSSSLDNLKGIDCEIINASITDRIAVRNALSNVDYVFHLAAIVEVEESMRNIRECIEINTCGLINVLEESARQGVKKVIFASSAAVYGNSPQLPKEESMPPEPISPYAITKLDGELYMRLFESQGHFAAVSARFFNVFGPRQNILSSYSGVVSSMLDRISKNHDIVINGDGHQTRDLIYVKDVVDALGFLAFGESLSGSFNIGYGNSMSVRDLATKLIHMTNTKANILYASQRSGDVKHSLASIKKLTDAGWLPSYGIHRGLIETIDYYLTKY